MIVRIVKLTILRDQVGTFLDHFNRVSSAISTFPGCSHLELLTGLDEPEIVFTYSIWDNETSLRNYLGSDLFRSTWGQVKPLFGARAEAWSLLPRFDSATTL
jgi:heme-degrading monooxygenase HmoA